MTFDWYFGIFDLAENVLLREDISALKEALRVSDRSNMGQSLQAFEFDVCSHTGTYKQMGYVFTLAHTQNYLLVRLPKFL